MALYICIPMAIKFNYMAITYRYFIVLSRKNKNEAVILMIYNKS